jgi:hypothetical protein
MIPTMFELLSYLIRGIKPVLIPLCFAVAWLIVLVTVRTIYGAIASTLTKAKQMHQIPCTGCQFFTNDHRLKCPVQPKIALTEEAIGCRDYWAKK